MQNTHYIIKLRWNQMAKNESIRNLLWAIGKTRTVPQRALDCRPDLGGLKIGVWLRLPFIHDILRLCFMHDILRLRLFFICGNKSLRLPINNDILRLPFVHVILRLPYIHDRLRLICDTS